MEIHYSGYNLMPKKKPYYANNWKELHEAPSELFEGCSYKEFMKWKIHGWSLSSSHICVIRATTRTGKVKEYSYKQSISAHKKIDKLLDDENITELTICDDDQIQLIDVDQFNELHNF